MNLVSTYTGQNSDKKKTCKFMLIVFWGHVVDLKEE